MLGRSHALSGVVVSATLGTYVWHQPLPVLATGAILAGGAAVLPDIDTQGSCVARSFGCLSEGLAWVMHRISGGHREGTHTGVGDVTAAGIAVLALALEPFYFRHRFLVLGHPVPVAVSAGRLMLAVYLALLIGSALSALNLIRRDHRREILAAAAAVAMTWTGWDAGGIAWAILLGTSVHCLGDGVTEHGVPWLKPFSNHVFHLLPERLRISTGHRAERAVIVPLLLAALVLLGWHDAGSLAIVHHARTAIGATP